MRTTIPSRISLRRPLIDTLWVLNLIFALELLSSFRADVDFKKIRLLKYLELKINP